MHNTLKTFFYRISFLLDSFRGCAPGDERVFVLMYHSIERTGRKIGVSPEEFAKQMEFLHAHRKVASMKELLDHLYGKTLLPDGSIVVTIDDGYKDTFTDAFPILKRFKIPFTLFLTTDLSPMEKLGNLPRPTWEELRTMHESGLMTIGLHGHKHKNIQTIIEDQGALDSELRDSALLIERELGVKPDLYAYAFGYRHPRAEAYLKSIGVRAAFSISDGAVRKGDGGFALHRVQIDRTMAFPLFRLRTTGGVDVAAKISKMFGR